MSQAPAPGAAYERLAEQMEKIVINRISNDQLVLPPMPAVALKVLTLLKNPDFSLKEAATTIERDPILTVQVLKAANSAAMGSRDPIQSVLQAVTRFGVQKLRTFLIEMSARKIFESRDARIVEAARGVWEHSLAVAMLARDVVAFSNSGAPDFGYLGGLLHDIGKPIVAAMLLEAENSHSAVYYAAWALHAGAEDAETAASIAKAYVGDASRKVCGDAIQVHGGIGFTWEFDLHMYFKRAKALEAQYGDADYHRELILETVAK